MVGICFSPAGGVITAAILGAPTVGTAGVAIGTGATIAVEAGLAGTVTAAVGGTTVTSSTIAIATGPGAIAVAANPVGLAILGSVLIVGASETPELYTEIIENYNSENMLGINYVDIL